MPRRRGMVAVDLSAVFPLPSRFNEIVSNWGYAGFSAMPAFSIRAAYGVTRWFQFGGRIGYQHGDAGRASYDPANLTLDLFETGAVARFVHEWAQDDGLVRHLGVDLEAGFGFGVLSLRGVDAPEWVPRMALMLVAGFSTQPHWPGLTFRFGYVYIPLAANGIPFGESVVGGIVGNLSLELPW